MKILKDFIAACEEVDTAYSLQLVSCMPRPRFLFALPERWKGNKSD